jgi:hypothetical protein
MKKYKKSIFLVTIQNIFRRKRLDEKQQECCFVLILSFSFLMSFGAGVETPAPFLWKLVNRQAIKSKMCEKCNFFPKLYNLSLNYKPLLCAENNWRVILF